MFSEIYRTKNQITSSQAIWGRLIEETAELTSFTLRDGESKEVENALPDIFAWLMAFCYKNSLDLQNILWQKFANGCPYCKAKQDCTCYLAKNGDIPSSEGKSKKLDKFLGKQPQSLDEWQKYLKIIYGKSNKEQNYPYLLVRLTEDIGFVAKALRTKSSSEFVHWKLASVFAWFVAFYNKFSSENNLSKLIWQKYKKVCPHCKEQKCICLKLEDFHFYVSIHSSKKHDYQKIIGILRKHEFLPHSLRKTYDGYKSLKNLIKIYQQSNGCIFVLEDIEVEKFYSELTLALENIEKDFIYLYLKEPKTSKDISFSWKDSTKFLNFRTFENIEDLKLEFENDLTDIRANFSTFKAGTQNT